MESSAIEFRLHARSGVSPYLQIVQQVRDALRLGLLDEGDQLPTVKEVLKAYRELEHAGLVAARPGVGTFITGSLADPVITANGRLRSQLRGWIVQARQAGLDEESIEALFRDAVRSAHIQEVA
jgi:GntR family transcriptional regulator